MEYKLKVTQSLVPKKNIARCELQDGIRMNAQTKVQCEINFHKPKKKVVNTIQTKMMFEWTIGEPNSRDTSQTKLGDEPSHLLLYYTLWIPMMQHQNNKKWV